jgi:hypothetical protein
MMQITRKTSTRVGSSYSTVAKDTSMVVLHLTPDEARLVTDARLKALLTAPESKPTCIPGKVAIA